MLRSEEVAQTMTSNDLLLIDRDLLLKTDAGRRLQLIEAYTIWSSIVINLLYREFRKVNIKMQWALNTMRKVEVEEAIKKRPKEGEVTL